MDKSNSEIRDAGQERTKEWIKAACDEIRADLAKQAAEKGVAIHWHYTEEPCRMEAIIARHVPVSAPVPQPTETCKICQLPHRNPKHLNQAVNGYHNFVPAPVPERTKWEGPQGHKATCSYVRHSGFCDCGWNEFCTRKRVAAPVPEPEGKKPVETGDALSKVWDPEPPARKDETLDEFKTRRTKETFAAAKARKDELGTCDTIHPGNIPHTREDCGMPINWTPVAPQASPEAPAKEMSNDPRVIVTYIWSEVETGTHAQAETILEAYVEQRMAGRAE